MLGETDYTSGALVDDLLVGECPATGVGFVAKIHGQTGVAPNGIEFHPVTAERGLGARALARWRATGLDLVILNLQLPGVTGAPSAGRPAAQGTVRRPGC